MQTARRPVVAVLCRKDENPDRVKGYALYGMTQHWIANGINVEWIFGPQRQPAAADLLFMHVNLTVIPKTYIDYAKHYSRVINGQVTDIRKSTVCDFLVKPGDGYHGPVIVKTDLNAAGRPEQRARSGKQRRLRRWLNRFAPSNLDISAQEDYRIYKSADEVPSAVFRDKRYVVQRMLAEREGDTYFVRNYSFLGERYSCTRLSSNNPVIHLRNTLAVEEVEVDPRIVAMRHRLGFDYGKLDYVIHNGEAVLLDANKTLGVRDVNETDSTVLAMRRERANGIFAFLGMEAPDTTRQQ